MRGLERDPSRRFSTALEMATALEAAVGLLAPREVGAWVERLSRARLDARRAGARRDRGRGRPPRRALPRSRPAMAEPDSALSLAAHVSTPPGCLPREERPTVPDARPRRRAPAIAAWGVAAAVVATIAAGIGVRSLAGLGATAVSLAEATPW